MTDLHGLRCAKLSLREGVLIDAIVAELVIVLDRDCFSEYCRFPCVIRRHCSRAWWHVMRRDGLLAQNLSWLCAQLIKIVYSQIEIFVSELIGLRNRCWLDDLWYLG